MLLYVFNQAINLPCNISNKFIQALIVAPILPTLFIADLKGFHHVHRPSSGFLLSHYSVFAHSLRRKTTESKHWHNKGSAEHCTNHNPVTNCFYLSLLKEVKDFFNFVFQKHNFTTVAKPFNKASLILFPPWYLFY